MLHWGIVQNNSFRVFVRIHEMRAYPGFEFAVYVQAGLLVWMHTSSDIALLGGLTQSLSQFTAHLCARVLIWVIMTLCSYR